MCEVAKINYVSANLFFKNLWPDHSGDEIFAKFYAALDEINFFKTSPAGTEDPGLLSKATQYFNDALLVK
jgi:hypothetical protein